MKNRVLLFADPHSIHTKKWSEGWKLIGYNPIISGISRIEENNLIIKEDFNPLGGNGIIYLKNLFKFKKNLQEIDPVILNPHFLTSYGFIAALLKRKKDFLVMSVHGTDIMVNMDKNFIYLQMAKYIFKKSDLIISVSDIMTNKILKYFPYLKNKIITQQYGVNINLLNKYKQDKKDILISTNRQWKPNSNYPIILELLSKFKDRNIKLIGAYNDDYSNHLLNKYKDLQPYSTGMVKYEQNLEYVGKSKFFISLTTSDGIPLSVIEAMYLGAIPIVSNINPNKELIKDGINGFLVDIDSNKLEKKINELLNLSNDKIKEIQKNNEKLVLEKFDFEKNFENLKNILIKKGI